MCQSSTLSANSDPFKNFQKLLLPTISCTCDINDFSDPSQQTICLFSYKNANVIIIISFVFHELEKILCTNFHTMSQTLKKIPSKHTLLEYEIILKSLQRKSSGTWLWLKTTVIFCRKIFLATKNNYYFLLVSWQNRLLHL